LRKEKRAHDHETNTLARIKAQGIPKKKQKKGFLYREKDRKKNPINL